MSHLETRRRNAAFVERVVAKIEDVDRRTPGMQYSIKMPVEGSATPIWVGPMLMPFFVEKVRDSADLAFGAPIDHADVYWMKPGSPGESDLLLSLANVR